MLTTAGSTRFTIVENELAEGMGSGTTRGVAFVPLNDFIAETRPEITEPIMIPVTSVNATKNDAMIFRRRAQLKSSFTCSPISLLLDFPAAYVSHPKSEVLRTRLDGPPSKTRSKYNTANKGQLYRKIDAPGSSLSRGTGIRGMFCGRSFDSLKSLDAGTHTFVVKICRLAPEEPRLTAQRLGAHQI